MQFCILAFSLVFTAYNLSTVVLGELPFYFSGFCSSEAFGVLLGRLVACSVRISINRHTYKTNTVTLHVHAGRELQMTLE